MIQTSSMSLACNVLTAFSMPRSSLPGTGGKPKPTFALPQQDGDLVAKATRSSSRPARLQRRKQRKERGKNRNHAGMVVARKSPDFLDLSEF
jgi:hypothetical protein